MSDKPYQELLLESYKIAEDRQGSYGDVQESFEEIRDILKAMFGITLTVQDICKVMIALKTARQKYKYKDDNLVDLINYIAILKHLK